MKNYALYLLILCFSFIGCQKDIGDESTPKNKTASKYLPVELRRHEAGNNTHSFGDNDGFYTLGGSADVSIVISYIDNEGNIESIAKKRPNGEIYDKLLFEYYEGLLYGIVKENSDGEGWSFSYNNGKISSISRVEWQNVPNPDYYGVPPCENCPQFIDELRSVIETTIKWKGNQIDYLENEGEIDYQYNSECQLYKIISDGSSQTFSYSPKNYWAKDIKNKEILSILFPYLFTPTCHDINKIDYITNSPFPNYYRFSQYSNIYNNDDYPEIINYKHVQPYWNITDSYSIEVIYSIVD